MFDSSRAVFHFEKQKARNLDWTSDLRIKQIDSLKL